MARFLTAIIGAMAAAAAFVPHHSREAFQEAGGRLGPARRWSGSSNTNRGAHNDKMARRRHAANKIARKSRARNRRGF